MPTFTFFKAIQWAMWEPLVGQFWPLGLVGHPSSLARKHCRLSTMVWGCILASDIRDLLIIDGIINTEKYHQSLIHYAIASGNI